MSGSVNGSLMFHNIAQPPIAKREEQFAKIAQDLEGLTKRVYELQNKVLLPKGKAKGTDLFDLAQFHFSLYETDEYDKKSRLSCKHFLVLLNCFASHQQKGETPNIQAIIEKLQASAEKIDKMMRKLVANMRIWDAHLSESKKKVKPMHLMNSSSVASRSMMSSSYSSSAFPFDFEQSGISVVCTEIESMHEAEKKSRKKKRSLQDRQVEPAPSAALPVPPAIASVSTSSPEGDAPARSMRGDRFQHLVHPYPGTHWPKSGD